MSRADDVAMALEWVADLRYGHTVFSDAARAGLADLLERLAADPPMTKRTVIEGHAIGRTPSNQIIWARVGNHLTTVLLGEFGPDIDPADGLDYKLTITVTAEPVEGESA